jgi:hypothetical protein
MALRRPVRTNNRDDETHSQQSFTVLHRYGNHCDKTKIGESIGQQLIGIPIFDDHTASLGSLFHKLKGDGIMAKMLSC